MGPRHPRRGIVARWGAAVVMDVVFTGRVHYAARNQDRACSDKALYDLTPLPELLTSIIRGVLDSLT